MEHFSYDLLEEDDFKKAFDRFQHDYYAVNVTAPYKESAFKAADEPSPQCRAIGAANLLINRNGRVTAHNTDFIAVSEILQRWIRQRESPIGSQKPKVLVVGCGGAGKAAAAAALSVGAEVTIANRTPETVLKFIDRLKKFLRGQSHPADFPRDIQIRSIPLQSLPDEVHISDFIIYTLPLAVRELERCDFREKTVLEAKYYDTSIEKTPGPDYIPGTEWLRLQALATYRLLGL